MAHRTPRQTQPLGDSDPFVPTAGRPVRVRARELPADTHLEPHRHDWAQLSYCDLGIMQVSVEAADAMTYIVPPSRAVWIPPGARHAVAAVEDARLRTLYVHAPAAPPGWTAGRVIKVSALLRELIVALHRQPAAAREAALAQLILDELAQADTQPLGVPLPNPQTGDKRLRALCEAVLRAPGERATLAAWARDTGASERTFARLFRDELGTSFARWRQQVVLAHALPLLARGLPVGQVAAASGYASDSAFSAMFRAAMGQPPSAFQG